jgi:hypothetical protein
MDPANERRWSHAVGACVAWLAVVVAAAAIVYAGVGDESRPTVIRLATSLMLAIALMQVHKSLRRDVEGQARSHFDLEREPRLPAAKVDADFSKLRNELQHSLRSRRYFDSVLWPRVVALAGRHGTRLAPPPRRWLARRGPRLQEVCDLVSSVEREP